MQTDLQRSPPVTCSKFVSPSKTMRVKATLSHLISDFAGMSKTPDFKPKHDGHVSPPLEPSSPKVPTARRHSLNITVGATEIPRSHRRNSISVSSPTTDEKQPKFDAQKRRQSAPCVLATAGQAAALKKKLEQMKVKKTQSGEHIHEEEEEE